MSRSDEVSHRWKPIEDVPEDHAKLANIELPTLLDVWLEQKEGLETLDAVTDFNEQLLRRWAIETGLIERLYVLDRGVTQLLVERGLHASLIAHDSTNGDPDRVMAMIRDQHRAVEGLFDFVTSKRELSTSYIKQLHATITASQATTTAVNPLGQPLTVPLRRGDYKRRPNNPTTADGSVHEYCPPEQVASEMDRLITMHLAHEAKGVAPEVQAAWLHHRFAQIHPFEDGNGRVARALATLILLRAEWLPLVVTNDRREVYLNALNAADRGSLAPLVDLFAKIEKEAFLQALSVARDVIQQHQRVDHVIAAWQDDLRQRRRELRQERETAKETAWRLQRLTLDRLAELREKLETQLTPLAMPGEEFRFFVGSNSEGDRVDWFRYQLISTAKELRYYANLQAFHAWARLVVHTLAKAEILVSFHAVGHEYNGVLVGSASFYEKQQVDDNLMHAATVHALSDEVFQFNYKEPPSEVEQRFARWIDPVLVKGLGLVRAVR